MHFNFFNFHADNMVFLAFAIYGNCFNGCVKLRLFLFGYRNINRDSLLAIFNKRIMPDIEIIPEGDTAPKA